MAHYAIGDIQGCLTPLLALLDHIDFDTPRDTLWFAGDLVNRGPESLETLRFIKGLGNSAQVVLGNHDLHLLAVCCGVRKQNESDTLSDILKAPDGPELIHWLRKQPLARTLPSTKPAIMVHAGILPSWTLDQALARSQEVQAVLAGPQWKTIIKELYGNKPDKWNDKLTSTDRLRVIVNVMTRMRMLYANQQLDFAYKESTESPPSELRPWFEFPRPNEEEMIVFGHWSTLQTIQNKAGYCLDTGCVWGGKLTALRLDDEQLFEVDA